MERVKYIDDQRLTPQTNYQSWSDLLEYWGDFTDVRGELAPGVLILKVREFLERKKSNLPTDRAFTIRSSVVIVDIECVELIRLNIREHRGTKLHLKNRGRWTQTYNALALTFEGDGNVVVWRGLSGRALGLTVNGAGFRIVVVFGGILVDWIRGTNLVIK